MGPEGATSNVIVRALADIGLDALVGDRKAWVNVTREFLLEVRPLPADASRSLATLSAEGELPETVTDHLAQRSGGNPFFLEEALRDLVERGRGERRDGG